MHKQINIALLGFGTVGSGVAETIKRNGKLIEEQIGVKIQISRVLVRNIEKYKDNPLLQEVQLTDSFADVVNDSEIDIVVEVMGGIHPAKEYIFDSLNHGKNVVSANKDLVALFGPEIIHTAMENHVNFSCEASVGGGIPVLMPLHDSLAANEIESIVGIVNGTTNFILTSMEEEGLSYSDALRMAQKKGFAEADPTNDVCGYDAARKLAILASIGFRANVTFDDVLVEGIEKISLNDITYAREMGYVIKLLAVASRQENGIALNVYPAFVPKTHPLASIKGSYNAVYVTGNIVGNVMFYGRGAGSLPTASAVMGDVISTAKHILNHSSGTGMMLTETKRIPFYSSLKLNNSYYFRLIVDDVCGVLSQIASAYADNEISIKEVVQKSRIGDAAELMIITEATPRENIIHVEKALQVLPCMRQVANIVRVMENGTE
jgi:homoserine dehydrogenase